jgi:hypothetical protein
LTGKKRDNPRLHFWQTERTMMAQRRDQRSRRHFRNPRREGSTDAAPDPTNPDHRLRIDPIIVALEEYRRCRKLGLRLDRKP